MNSLARFGIVFLLTAACASPSAVPAQTSEQPRDGGVLKIVSAGDPVSFDVHQEASILSLLPVAPAYNGLVTLDPADPAKIVGDLAEKFDVSADGLVYTFTFRPKITWHDGVAFTAEDARFSFERMRNPPADVKSIRKPDLEGVQSVETPDERTLTITLKEPDESFLPQLATNWFVVMPKHILESKGNMKNTVVGTGPFKFKSYTPGVSVELVRNTNYFKPGLPHLDGVTMLIIKDTGTRLAALRTDQAQLTGRVFANLTPSDVETLKRDNTAVRVERAPGLGSPWLHMNVQRKPFDDVRVRQAISIGFDRDTAIKAVAEGAGSLGTFVPPGPRAIPDDELRKLPGFRQPKGQDVEEAKKLLAEAGVPNGFKTTMLCRDLDSRMCEYWKAQLQVLGVDAAIDVKAQAAVASLQTANDFELMVTSQVFRINDPNEIGRKWITGAPQNYVRYSNPQLDKLYREQSGARDSAARTDVVRKIARVLLDDAPTIQPYWEAALVGIGPSVRGYPIPPGQYSMMTYETVWLTR
jgi:peptide/nickel transport system substrate-binding protein